MEHTGYIISRFIGGRKTYLCCNNDLSFDWTTHRIRAWVTEDKDRAEKVACKYNFAHVEEIK